MQVQRRPDRGEQQRLGGALQPVGGAVHVPAGQRGKRAIPVPLLHHEVEVVADTVVGQVPLEQHGGNVRLAEAAGHLGKVAGEQSPSRPYLRHHVRKLLWVGAGEPALDVVAPGQRECLLELRSGGRPGIAAPNGVGQQRRLRLLLDLHGFPPAAMRHRGQYILFRRHGVAQEAHAGEQSHRDGGQQPRHRVAAQRDQHHDGDHRPGHREPGQQPMTEPPVEPVAKQPERRGGAKHRADGQPGDPVGRPSGQQRRHVARQPGEQPPRAAVVGHRLEERGQHVDATRRQARHRGELEQRRHRAVLRGEHRRKHRRGGGRQDRGQR